MANKIENNPYLRPPKHPHYKHRAAHHDYSRPAKYMITLEVASYLHPIAYLTGKLSGHDIPQAVPNHYGQYFVEALSQWSKEYPQIAVDSYVTMPDHIHLCIAVKEKLKAGLSRVIASLMGKTTKQWHFSNPSEERKFFEKGFTDSIAYTEKQYLIQKKYVADNPRRLMMKRQYPELYRQKWIITVGNLKLVAVGNIFLLKNPHIQVVRFSRQFSKEQLEANSRSWEECVRNGGVLISPFIHPHENEMMKKAMKEDGRIIRICDNGFSEKFAPTGKEFDYMSTTRFLLIGQIEFKTEKVKMSYGLAQNLNSIAEFLATHPESMRICPAQRRSGSI